MTLQERLSEQMKQSMKSGDKSRLAYARNLHAAIRKKEIDDRQTLTEEGVIQIISSLVKQRQDSIEQFQMGNRPDLVEKEQAELNFLQSFLPTPWDEAETRHWVDWAVAQVTGSGPQAMGQAMKLLAPKMQGRADGKRVNQLVREKLEQVSPL